MPIALSREKLIEIVGGEANQIQQRSNFHGVEFDSREIRGGELFVALPGATTHGHSFVDSALLRGAALCLVEDRAFLKRKDLAECIVVVPDTLKAFTVLANWWRKERGVPILAITGSVGKTTTKELAAQIALQRSPGVYSLKSYNNQVGVPYTLCRLGREHQWAVIEIGMNHPGEIAVLSKCAEPNVVVITTIAPAHLEAFASIAEIADEKLSIIEGLADGGTLVVNAKDHLLTEAMARNRRSKEIRTKRFGVDAGDVSVTECKLESLLGLSLVLSVNGRELGRPTVQVTGRHNAVNVAAAVAGVTALLPEISPGEILAGLKNFKAPLMRLNLRPLTEGRLLIDDSYNANPTSMAGALELVEDLAQGQRKVGLIIGDMLELGEQSSSFHDQIGERAAKLKPSFVIGVGEHAARLVSPASQAGAYTAVAADPEAAAELASKQPFDILLVKASRGVRLDRTVSVLLGRFSVGLEQDNS